MSQLQSKSQLCCQISNTPKSSSDDKGEASSRDIQGHPIAPIALGITVFTPIPTLHAQPRASSLLPSSDGPTPSSPIVEKRQSSVQLDIGSHSANNLPPSSLRKSHRLLKRSNGPERQKIGSELSSTPYLHLCPSVATLSMISCCTFLTHNIGKVL